MVGMKLVTAAILPAIGDDALCHGDVMIDALSTGIQPLIPTLTCPVWRIEIKLMVDPD